jgi:hypothetical protein
MNTIPTTFNENLPTYTAVGGHERRASTGISAVVLNRGGRYPRYSFFEELEKLRFDYVVSIESSAAHYDLESLSSGYPFVRFILPQGRLNRGEEINLAASELSCPLFFVLWNDLKFLRSGGAERMAERLLAGAQEEKNIFKRLCTTPLIQDARSETMPTLIVPALVPEKKTGKTIKTIPFVPLEEGQLTIYPFDGIGIYDRERFIRLNGFDPCIKNFYWQLMDFGFRSSLWGEEIASTKLIKLSYEGLVPEEDSTAGEDFLRFFLKNLAPVFKGDYAHIPLRRFPGYLKRRGGLLTAWDEFSSARAWVKTNRFRFSTDARIMTELFSSVETEEKSETESEDDRDDSARDDLPMEEK